MIPKRAEEILDSFINNTFALATKNKLLEAMETYKNQFKSEYPKEMWVKDDEIQSWWSTVKIIGKVNKPFPYIDESGRFWKFAKDIESEPLTIEITMDEAIEELKKSDKYKNKNLTIK